MAEGGGGELEKRRREKNIAKRKQIGGKVCCEDSAWMGLSIGFHSVCMFVSIFQKV